MRARLTDRLVDLIQLVRKTGGNIPTIAELAAQYRCSSRTIIRDLKSIERHYSITRRGNNPGGFND